MQMTRHCRRWSVTDTQQTASLTFIIVFNLFLVIISVTMFTAKQRFTILRRVRICSAIIKRNEMLSAVDANDLTEPKIAL